MIPGRGRAVPAGRWLRFGWSPISMLYFSLFLSFTLSLARQRRSRSWAHSLHSCPQYAPPCCMAGQRKPLCQLGAMSHLYAGSSRPLRSFMRVSTERKSNWDSAGVGISPIELLSMRGIDASAGANKELYSGDSAMFIRARRDL